MLESKIYNTGESERELKEKYNYDGSELRNAQLRMIEMLSFLDQICRKNRIRYFISFGTLLGAVRHGGFIPWDDDLDVYIKDKDLKRLRNIVNNGNYSYVVQSHANDKGFVRYYNVLRDLKSEYIKDEYQHNQRKYRGIQIDLFPYEYDVIQFGKKIVAKSVGLNEKYLLGKHKVLSEFVFYFTSLVVIPTFKTIGRFKGKKYVALGYEGMLPGHVFPREVVFPLRRIKFEGLKVLCPNQPRRFLQIDYGDNYNDLPSVEKRDHHKVLNIVFKD